AAAAADGVRGGSAEADLDLAGRVGRLIADRQARVARAMSQLNKPDTKMALLEVKDLQVRVEEREILHGLTLTVNEG
ncbi:hypothetical protein ABTL77_20715, partial [Acinetobacter baumannii]